ncbi:hypothetical protein AMTR_s00108p00119250 [Amborella trichopoda]|uniref:DUF659 domain-containing protein n=1 Tax=Amborella trichopoda TaxID=13333 RepID=W1NUS1_AMBTC|nr:hypothetical protein AMTR_s00108p00119250 [Amborella trichopoda]
MLGRYVGKWFYNKGIPFDAVNSPYFPPMVNAIQRVGLRVKPPTTYELNGPILDEEVEEVRKWIEEYKQSWPRTVITLISDSWLNKVRKILDEEVEEVRKWIEEYKQSRPRTVITLMSDSWLNKVSKKEFVNFLAYSPKGTAFLSSKDISGMKNDTNFYV